MEEFTLTSDRIIGVREKSGQHMLKSESLGLWKRLLNGLKASFNAPFESAWEKKAGLHWRDWGKL